MTFYALPDHLSFCEVDGRTIFLDLRRDRYVELDAETRSILHRWQEADASVEGGGEGFERLERLGLVIRSAKPASPAATCLEVPTRSVRDEPSRTPQRAWPIVPEVLALLRRTRLTLKRAGLEGAVNEVRLRNAGESGANPFTPQLGTAAERYRAARRLVPIRPNCLLDSLSLSAFLSRRGHKAALVFGVKLDPFAAHCWLQTDDAIVNDGADSVSAFTPVLAV